MILARPRLCWMPSRRGVLCLSAQRGFTLLELIVAIALAALVIAAAPGALSRAYDAMEYRSTLRQLLAGLKSARQLAMESGRPVAFVVDLRERRFGIGEALKHTLPAGLEIRLQVADREIDAQQRGAIRFYADGSATGGSIELLRASGDGLRLRVDWLLGRVSQEELLSAQKTRFTRFSPQGAKQHSGRPLVFLASS